MEESLKYSQSLPDYNPEQYLKQLIVVRDAYNSGKFDDHPKSYDVVLNVAYIGTFCAIGVFSFVGKNWLVLGLAFVFLIIKLISANRSEVHRNKYDEAIIAIHLNAGFTRTQATEFIYDQDWDDIQYDESRLDFLKEKIQNAKNK